mmetsp:Transcript_14698/g.42309  ORF Transcript_14698/g.42309 Transcript_14698/m.42309 type:complete len:208 (-) Transcript_14698:2300-2923(-)
MANAGAGARADSGRPGRKNSITNVPGTITDTIAVAVLGATILVDETSFVGALIDSVDNSVTIGIHGTAQDTIIGDDGEGSGSFVRRLVNLGIRIVNVVGTVDGTIAHVNSIEHSVQVAVEGTANAINDDDAIDVGATAINIVLVICLAFDPVTIRLLVRVGVVLVGVGTAVAHVDRVGNQVVIAIGTTEDGQPLLSVRNSAVVSPSV